VIARLELLRLWRSRRPLLALASVGLFLGLMLLGFYTYAQSKTGGGAEFRYTYENRSYFNGLTFALYAFYFGFLLILPIFAATEGGAQIAGETSAGTLDLLLTRPLSRAKLFLTKLMIGVGLSTVSVGVLLLLALTIGLLLIGWGNLDLYPGVLQMTERRQHLDQSEALWRFLLAWPAASIALFVPLSLAFLVSVWVKNPVNAVGTAIAIYLVLYVVSEVHFFEDLRPWLFTSYMSYWRGLFREEIEWSGLARDAATLCGFGFLFLGLSFRRFYRREEF
jgi:ABC-2 type transport system permease protein